MLIIDLEGPTSSIGEAVETISYSDLTGTTLVQSTQSLAGKGTVAERREQMTYDNDIRSLVSWADEESEAPPGHWTLHFENAIIAVLATREELVPLYKMALDLMSDHRLANNLQRQFYAFYTDLNTAENLPFAKRLAAFFRSKKARSRIARVVVDRQISSAHSLTEEDLKSRRRYDATVAQNLEDWLQTTKEFSSTIPQSGSSSIASSASGESAADDEDSGDEDEFEHLDTPGLTHAIHSLVDSKPFMNMVTGLKQFLLPRGLLDDLLSIPREDIKFESQAETLINRLQGFFEDISGLQWDWWPLKPRKRHLQPYEVRVIWTCHCKEIRWKEMHVNQAEILKMLLRENSQESIRHPFCAMLTKASMVQNSSSRQDPEDSNNQQTSLLGYKPNSLQPQSTSGMQRPGAMLPSPPSKTSSSTNAHSSSGSSSANPQNSYQTAVQASSGGARKLKWLVFGTTGGRHTLEIGQVGDLELSSDLVFLRKLKKEHTLLRGRIRSYLSLWKLDHWEFVKFRRYQSMRERIIMEKIDLPPPEAKDYDFLPRPPNTTAEELISHHEFQMLMRVCTSSHRFTPYNIFHDCLRFDSSCDWLVKRLPKKLTQIEVDAYDQVNDIAWGIEAKFVLSAIRVFALHLLFFLPSLGFWIWWQNGHPGDLQNASIPISVFLGFASMFWSTVTISNSYRMAA
jgi:hypothetical protein